MSNKNIFAYHLFKAAQEKYGRKPADLRDQEAEAASEIARKTMFVEERILHADASNSIVVTALELRDARNDIISRYDSFCDFLADLDASGLDDVVLSEAIERQLIVERTMETVVADVEAASEREIADLYSRRRADFVRPEQRVASHILITINPDYPENERGEANRRIKELFARVREEPQSFGLMAQLHSECPSALRGGDLGVVSPGKLMQPLEDAIFALRPGEIGGPVETEAGFHIAKCDQIIAARTVSLDEAREKIADAITSAKKQKAKQQWIKQICASAAQTGPKASQPTRPTRSAKPVETFERVTACVS